MAYLYKNYKGDEVNNHSYSSGSDFRFCRRKYQLKKLLGWKERDENATMKFGIAFESAIQYFHANGLKSGSGVEEFKRLWLAWKENTTLVYKDKDGGWADFYKAGSQLLALYELMLPTLPIHDPVFQAQVKREVFPGTTLAGISDLGYIDMLSRAPWVHPLLPKVDIPGGSEYRPVVIDIKTSGAALDNTPGILALDPQLASYAWLSGIADVGFLWAQRSKPDSYQKGTEVTFLEPSGKWKPMDKGVVVQFNEEADTLLVAGAENIDAINAQFAEIKGKGTKDRSQALTVRLLTEGLLTPVPIEAVSKQRLTFSAVRISQEDILETGQIVAKEIVEIHDANEKNFWPKDGAGIRFPKANCSWCSMRGICLKDDNLRDQLLVQIAPATAEPDWLDELENAE